MRVLSKRAILAIEAVAAIACGVGAKSIQSAEIYKSLGLLPRSLEPILQRLVRAGILQGSRGPKGGYSLNRAPIDISLAEIVEATQQLDGEQEPEGQVSSSELVRTVIVPMLDDLNCRWTADLRNVTVHMLTGGRTLA